jgi:hypothetical protein
VDDAVAAVALARDGAVVDFALAVDLYDQRVGLGALVLAPWVLGDGDLGKRAAITKVFGCAWAPA